MVEEEGISWLGIGGVAAKSHMGWSPASGAEFAGWPERPTTLQQGSSRGINLT